MGCTQSKKQTKKDLEALKSLGEIVAIAKHPDSISAVYKDGSLRISKSYGFDYVSKHKIPETLDIDPWLMFQVDIYNGLLIMSDVKRFCHQTSDHTWRADDMIFHKKFEIFFPFSNEWEVEIEII